MTFRYSIEEARAVALSRGGKCLSPEYVSGNLEWECENGHRFSNRYTNVANLGNWCKHCWKVTIDMARRLATKLDLICLSEAYINKDTPLTWKCKEGHIFERLYSNLKNGSGSCPDCIGHRHPTLTIEDAKQVAREGDGECLSTEYKSTAEDLLWRCNKCNHEWSDRFSYIRRDGFSCPSCCKPSKWRSEDKCREILERLFGVKFPNDKPPFLNGLRIDCYNEDLKYGLEYQGKQHYERLSIYQESKEKFEEQLVRDQTKVLLCYRNGVKLIFVPYTYTFRNPVALEKYILLQIEVSGMVIPPQKAIQEPTSIPNISIPLELPDLSKLSISPPIAQVPQYQFPTEVPQYQFPAYVPPPTEIPTYVPPPIQFLEYVPPPQSQAVQSVQKQKVKLKIDPINRVVCTPSS